ncbi:carbohydrate-binding protein [Kutzneria sp. NPDC052558]|uniref:carbohydrate-binding protein n=1 Tax=Kutzneria sp. NPDC052558 TaxID=3364121 RepID=UPI0037CC48A2
MDPFDPMPPGGDGRRLDRVLVWTATAGALGCSVLIFLATNVSEPDPVAEPVPTTRTAAPVEESTTETTSATTTVAGTTTKDVAPTVITNRPATSSQQAASNPPVRQTQPQTTCPVAQWQRDTAYDGGAVVAYGGRLWMAKWWNYNAVPGANAEGVWLVATGC